jgi:signal peptidase I
LNPSEKSTVKTELSGLMKFRKDWVEPLLIAVIAVTIIKVFFFQNFKIPSSSMEDTLLIGDYLFAVKFLYGTKIPFTNKVVWKIRDPKPNDIIVFRSVEEKKDLIKRCIAVPGQTVEIRNAQVYVNGILQQFPKHGKLLDSKIIPEGAEMSQRDNIRPFKVPEGRLFMMGDNRDNSYDSRFWGFLPIENVKGKAVILYWSWNNTVPFYDVIHKVRLNRILNLIR